MKKQLLTRVLCCLLVAVMMVFTLAACAGDTTPDTPDKPQDPTTPSTDGGKDDPAQPSTPQSPSVDYITQIPVENFEEAYITILCREDKEYEMFTEEDSASLVDQAVYARNERVEELYNVIVETYPVAGSWEEQTTFAQMLSQSVSVGDDAYQIAATHTAYNASLSLQEQYYDLRSLDSIDLSAPWWSQSFNENCTVHGKLFITTGDLSLTMWEGLYAIFFNREMAEDYGVGNLYQMVRDDEWTIEALTEITGGLYTDDGNQTVGPEDTYGLLINRHSMRAFITTCNLPLCERDANGDYQLVHMDADHIDKVVTVYDALYELVYENDGTFDSQLTDGVYTEMQDVFTGGRALFMMGTLENAPVLRASDMMFGILPFPKYDEEQEDYYAHSYDGLSSFGIPASAQDPEMCARILDALSAENKTSVIPAYNEIVLDSRVARDEDSKAMLGIIRDNLYFDFGFVYSDPLKGDSAVKSGPFARFGDELRLQTPSYTSAFAQYEEVYKTNLEKVMDTFAE
ncbi:MAG: hypothetical protein J6R04_05740 [Clostridia bacterium]|nr:hypothetical protein [Clostridia bacterium]